MLHPPHGLGKAFPDALHRRGCRGCPLRSCGAPRHSLGAGTPSKPRGEGWCGLCPPHLDIEEVRQAIFLQKFCLTPGGDQKAQPLNTGLRNAAWHQRNVRFGVF